MCDILLIHNAPTRFVRIDLALLRSQFHVTDCYIQRRQRLSKGLISKIRSHRLVLGWFASWHTLLPVLLARAFGKPVCLIVGGYDTAQVPEAGYGSQRGGLRKLIANAAMHNATHLITNSHSAKRETMANVGISAEKITVIHHGLPPIPPKPMTARKPLAITVGNVWQENLLRKGLLPFVQAAALLPSVQFAVVGKWRDDSINTLRQIATPNVTFTGFVSDDELQTYYQTASVYVQASLHEGFGMSVAEAMLGGCLPIVSNKAALPELVGTHGRILPSTDPAAISAEITTLLNAPASARSAARQHILTNFSLQQRESALRKLISTLYEQDHAQRPSKNAFR